ncbi:hypothetical protein IGB42_04274 [Andreprevotia sp. IGB-42]|nr:hypothetical protein IGB42_04274 [Andreprevotia sp. IGB-42]
MRFITRRSDTFFCLLCWHGLDTTTNTNRDAIVGPSIAFLYYILSCLSEILPGSYSSGCADCGAWAKWNRILNLNPKSIVLTKLNYRLYFNLSMFYFIWNAIVINIYSSQSK